MDRNRSRTRLASFGNKRSSDRESAAETDTPRGRAPKESEKGRCGGERERERAVQLARFQIYFSHGEDVATDATGGGG